MKEGRREVSGGRRPEIKHPVTPLSQIIQSDYNLPSQRHALKILLPVHKPALWSGLGFCAGRATERNQSKLPGEVDDLSTAVQHIRILYTTGHPWLSGWPSH